jgi:diguanylate cyclase (GGDEF)-like protein
MRRLCIFAHSPHPQAAMSHLRSVQISQARRRFLAFVALPAACLAGALVLFGVWSMWITIEKSDEASRARQEREVRLAIGATLDRLAQGQVGIAIWDQAVDHVRTPKPDAEWLDQNVGTWLNYVFRHDLDVIIDGTDRPVYAMQKGECAGPQAFAQIKTSVTPLVLAARGKSGVPANPHERLPNRELHPDSTVRTSDLSIHATDLVEINGRAALASVMQITSGTRDVDAPGTEPLLVSIRYLNSAWLDELRQDRGILAPSITKAPPPRGSAEYSIPLTSFRGEHIGYFSWRPEMPGKVILRTVGLEGGTILVGLLGVLAALVAGVAGLMARDAESIVALEEARIELQATEAQAQYLANHDSLTSLPNRGAFGNFVAKAIDEAGADRPLAVMLLDLDRFKQVNDTLGHLAGDQLIQAAAIRILACVGEHDVVARLGGDEFAICMVACSDTDCLVKAAEAIGRELRKPFEIVGSVVHVSSSIGIACCGSSGGDVIELIRKADTAMYRAKEEGGDTYRFFTAEMDESTANRRIIEDDLRAALCAGNQLFVEYQPKLNAADSSVIGLEALVRWQHPTRGMLAPDAFISVAEDCGLIDELGNWVLAQACQVASRWPTLSVAVNLSPIQFRDPQLSRSIRTIVQDAGIEPEQVELEVTEGILVEDDELVRATLKDLRESGFRIALDDFGTGYSSLSYLKKFKVDRLKIDRTFVKRLGQDAEANAIVQAVIALGHAMQLSVTAEGVETREQESLLQVAGCNELQGYLFSKALLEKDLHTFVGTKPHARPGSQMQVERV